MKKSLFLLFSILIFIFLLLFENCGIDNPEPEGSWTEAEKESYDQVINLQDEIGDNLDDWFQTMDSLDAINEAYQAFVNSESVSSATISSQGITVQYKSGIRGGIFLNPLDGNDEVGEPNIPDPVASSGDNLKSMVNQKKLLLINPHYYERDYYTDQIRSKYTANLNKVGIERWFKKDYQATVDEFTTLSDYGIIHVYSHGAAWPKAENITEVYLLTGETANETTSKKYFDELKRGNIPIMLVDKSNKYFISPEFISNHNDFSNDTILFYGGFCYSFLGGWPDIIDGFADGAYMGFDWSVYTFRNANWAVNCMHYLSDTALTQPMTLQGWFDNTDVDLSYWNERDNRTVSIQYTGDGNLKLWDDVSVRLIPLSSDGVPVSVPGEAGTAYPFRCEVVTNVSDLEFIWDIGNGSSPVSASNEVNITWSEEGNFVLKVDVKDKSNSNIIGTASVDITIGSTNEEELIDFVKKCTFVSMSFGPESAFLWEEGKPAIIPYVHADPGDWEWDYAPIIWNGLSFSATFVNDQNQTQTINGGLSGDGYTVSAVGEQEGHEIYGGYDFTYKLGFENYPVQLPLDPIENRTSVSYSVDNSSLIQNYVITFEGQMTWENGHIVNYTGVEWDEIERLIISFHWLPVESLE